MSIQIPILDENNIAYEIKDVNNGFYSMIADVLQMNLEQFAECLVNGVVENDIPSFAYGNHELLSPGEPATLQTLQQLIMDGLVNKTKMFRAGMDTYPVLLRIFPEISYIIELSVEILDDGTCYYPTNYICATCTPCLKENEVTGTPIYIINYTHNSDNVAFDYKQLLINDTDAIDKVLKNLKQRHNLGVTFFYTS